MGKKNFYETELRALQVELVKLQELIKHKKLKVVVIFEGRDAAGKGGVIKRITQRLNPRICRVCSPRCTDRKRRRSVVFPAICKRTAGCRRNGPF